ncbi:stomatin-like protein 2, mitochondrial [Acropora millepora]|uniref:stomatin-like protein 2, mitochondrial n=1 Tax=Acropora millepora TaxID=45264 RepID=UPI001CF33243|nr:stomatin-like protein 2, mitochondrial [Acropora millepora]
MLPTRVFRKVASSPCRGFLSSKFSVRTLAYGYSRTKRKQLPVNTVIKFVPQQEAWVIERFGKFNRILDPGLAILLPVIDEIKYVQTLKEVAIEIPSQSAITLDNVTLHLDGVLYLRVVDPFKASYGVEDPEFAVTQLAQTTMRSELGKISLDNVFQERERLNHNIVEAINHAAEVWGIRCLRYEIRDIQLPESVVEAMQMQVEAERKKRAAVLKSEGEREAAINVAEGKKQSQILASEARKMEQINIATGEANAIVARAKARADGIQKVSLALQEQLGEKAASLSVAELYVNAFGNLAKTNNTVVLPANVGDAASMVAQAMAVYGQLTGKPNGDPSPSPPGLPDTTPEDKGTRDGTIERSIDGSSQVSGTFASARKEFRQVEGSQDQHMKWSPPSNYGKPASSPTPHFTAATSPTRARDFH